jgi:hypothetical protein
MKLGAIVSLVGGAISTAGSLLTAVGLAQITDPDGVVTDLHRFRLVASTLFLVLGIALLTIAWGFWAERVWSRHVTVAFWPACALGTLWLLSVTDGVEGGLLFSASAALFFALVAAWYFYVKPDVRAYFDELRYAAIARAEADV